MNKYNKKGQFYLVAAIVIIVIIIGLSSVTNISRVSDSERLEDIKEELSIEGERVLDYESRTGISQFKDFTQRYEKHIGDSIDMYFVYGNESELGVYKYVNNLEEPVDWTISGNKIEVTIDNGEVYQFDLKSEGKNFYFILSQDIGGERYILTG